jgi:hypothetical protein
MTRTLRILIILAVIVLTGFDVISSNPGLVWIYGLLVVIVLTIVMIREKPWVKQ